MPPVLSPLPIDPVLPELVAALRGHSNAVLRAPTGAGKTTRVPPDLLAAGIAALSAGQTIVMTEPRRVAARAAARRIAEEQGWTLGREVGYQVRFEKKAGPAPPGHPGPCHSPSPAVLQCALRAFLIP